MTNRNDGTKYVQDSGGESMTRQSETDSTDINKIMGKWRATGEITHINVQRPVYEDFTTATDFLSAKLAVRRAEDLFMSLPARVRARVDNDPAKFIAFAEDPRNEEELRELGLINPITKREEPQPITNGGEPPVGEESDPA